MTVPAIALSDVLSGTTNGLLLGTASDGRPATLAWRPQIVAVQAPPVTLVTALRTLVDQALAWPDGQSSGVVAVLPAVLMAAISDHPRLEVLDEATLDGDTLQGRLQTILDARAALGVLLPADGSALLVAQTVWSRLTDLRRTCLPLLITAGPVAPPRHLSMRCCHLALQPTYPTHTTLAADDNGRWTLTPWAADGVAPERLVLTLGRPAPLEQAVGATLPRRITAEARA